MRLEMLLLTDAEIFLETRQKWFGNHLIVAGRSYHILDIGFISMSNIQVNNL